VDLKQLRYFVQVAKSRSLTLASGTAWITQSALSRQMRLLEEDLGVQLFVRQARGVELTQAGAALMEQAQQLLHQADVVRATVGSISHEPSGVLRIGAPSSLRPMLIAPLVALYHKAFPKVQVCLREGTSRAIRDALARGELDVIIVSSLEPLSPFATQALARESLYWVGPPGARLSLSRRTTIKLLATRPLILTAYPNSLRLIVDKAFAARGILHPAAVEADMASMMLDLVRRGVGFAVLPYSAIHEELAEHKVSASPVAGLTIDWVVATSSERPRTVALDQLEQALRRQVDERIKSDEWRGARRLASA
jgi:LysR family transcriptional regulator, nitrogen assimilation regulatory protein